MYNIDSLKEGIKKCDENIVTFEEAIKGERRTQDEYREMIETLQRKEKEAANAPVVKIEVERE